MAGESFIDQLAEVSRRQGKPFIDPTRIQGFGDGAPPAPVTSPNEEKEVHIPTAAEIFGGEAVEPLAVEPTPSPLVQAGLQAIPTPTPMPQSDVLLIVDRVAAYKNRGVELTDSEHAAVVAVVLKGLKRSMSEQYAEIEKLLPKRKKRVKVAAVAADQPVKKKRGRPKKVKSSTSAA